MKKFLVLFFTFIISFQCFAFRFAYTVNSKTLVYADKSLKIPIGYIKAGRKLKVADKSFKRDTIVGIIVAGRVAFIETKDLQFEIDGNKITDNPKIKEHDVDILFATDEDKLTENNFITLTFSTIDAGSDWDTFNQNLGDENSSDVTSYQVKMEHRSPRHKYGFSFGLSWLTSTSEGADLKTLVANAEYQHRFFQSTMFSIEAYGGLNLSGDIKVETRFGEVAKGLLYGYSAGGRIRLFPFSKYGVYGALGVQKLSINSIEELTTNNGITILESLGGPQISVGVHYKL
jgi:hypothetical protein